MVDFIKDVMKKNFTNGTWSQEYIEELMQAYLNNAKIDFTQTDLDELEEFFEPTKIDTLSKERRVR